jgi:hypothetical protein
MDDASWYCIWLDCGSGLSTDAKTALQAQAIDAYLHSSKSRKISGPGYEGLMTRGNFAVIGAFGSQVYKAYLDTDKGLIHASFLIRDEVRGRHATYLRKGVSAN